MKKSKKLELPTIEKEVSFPLTDKEIADLGRRNAELDAKATELDLEFESKREEHKARLKEIESERRLNSARIRKGEDARVVTCHVEHDYAATTVRYYHENRVIEERAMQADELQLDWTKGKRMPPGDWPGLGAESIPKAGA